ncbi:MAG TPA: deoxyribodipyrimidine photolyase, partial [Gammaproteobacteria bacterium]|nr:deoxyribodipyrimidine photolyase [Gammaproteobacteria bacterium]
MAKTPSLMWFRQDLRLNDNPALTQAAQAGPVLPIYILDDCNPAPWQMGAASRWWLHQSLEALGAELQNKLVVLKGDPQKLITELVA